MIELICLKELISIKLMIPVNVLFFITSIFLKFRFQPKAGNSCHDLIQKVTTGFNDVAIVSIRGNDHRINFWYMSKDEAINASLSQKVDYCKKFIYLFTFINV